MDVDEETKLMLAALESYQSGKITPLLKEELKYRIQSRRLGEGKAELTLEDQPTSPASPSQLRPDEIERQKKRRDQNRRAAVKFRLKKKRETDKLSEVARELRDKNAHLKAEVERLTAERNTLHFTVVSMVTDDATSVIELPVNNGPIEFQFQTVSVD